MLLRIEDKNLLANSLEPSWGTAQVGRQFSSAAVATFMGFLQPALDNYRQAGKRGSEIFALDSEYCTLNTGLDRRKPVWQLLLLATTSCMVQGVLFLVLSSFIPQIDDLALLWLCPEDSAIGYGSWLAGSYAASSISMISRISTCGRPEAILHLTPGGDIRQWRRKRVGLFQNMRPRHGRIHPEGSSRSCANS
jgi:hypothetical protein